jgi:2-C-methyl-D-erythritol 4-phosphate cytidylyltransferase/2-C-methyl-D-erythritol 2,4-cyclodiphosphate synthase
MTEIVALIVAAGRGHRVGGETPKQYCDIRGQTVLERTVRAFLAHPEVDNIQVVIHADDQELYAGATSGLPLNSPIIGGSSRQDSVRRGLESVTAGSDAKVLIHDAARPYVDERTISAVIGSITQGQGAIAARPLSDSLSRAKDGLIDDAIDRTDLWAAQTPQGFMLNEIVSAHRAAAGKSGSFTDDAGVARAAGLSVAIVEGNPENTKITTAADLAHANIGGTQTAMQTRVGMGFDVHGFDTARNDGYVTLCGIAIPHEFGLSGHSDADVGLHAITDAILGAVGAGDIGDHFPPSDPKWAGADSSIFLSAAMEILRGMGGDIAHIDLTLICEQPKIGPHRTDMRENIARICGAHVGQISVKATTTEKLGFTGRGEGIAGQAVATVVLP